MTKITTTTPRLQIAGIYLSNVFMVLISFRVPHRDYGSLNRFENKKKSKRKQNERKQNKKYCCCTIFISTPYSLYTQVMLILILINVQYLQNVVFSFEGGSNGQNHSSSGSHHLIKKFPSQQHF